MMNGYNFTERVRKVIANARRAATKRQHEYVGTEHLLLGLLEEGAGVAAAALQNMDVNLQELQRTIDSVVRPGNSPNADSEMLPYTSRAKKALELAMDTAREANHSYVGTEHLLLGIIREEKGIAAQALGRAGATYERTRKEIFRLLGTMDEGQATPPGSGLIASIRIHIETGGGTPIQGTFNNIGDAIAFLKRRAAIDAGRKAELEEE